MSGRARFVPALEGLRGLALAAVLCFHAGLGWAAGGYLALTTFFVLSGYLVASLLLRAAPTDAAADGHPRTTSSALATFWARRARRLVPAGLLGLAVIVVFFALIADADQLANARGDIAAALASVINWRFILEDQSYAHLFGAPSPALHLWSLSVEAQYYVVFPLAFFALHRVTRRSPSGGRVLAGALLAIAACSGAWALWLSTHGAPYDRVYYGTDTRCGELLVGAALACWLASARGERPTGSRVVQGAGVVAMGVLFWLFATVELGSAWLVHGGFEVVALISAVVVVACLEPAGPLRSVLSTAPVRRLGLISYAVYLFHWPVYLWLRQSYGWTGWRQLVVGSAVAVVLAELSYRFVEEPVRSGRLIHGSARVWWPVGAAVAIVVATIGVSVEVPVDPLSDVPAAADAPSVPPTAPVPVVDVVEAVDDPPHVVVVGDEAAPIVAASVAAWAGWHRPPSIDTRTDVPCGAALAPVVPGGPETCAGWVDEWSDALTGATPDLVVLAMASLDVESLLVAGGDATPDGLDPADADTVRSRLDAATILLSSTGAPVVIVELPADVGGGQSAAEANIRLGYSGLRDLAMSQPDLGFVAREEMPDVPAGGDRAEPSTWTPVLAPVVAAELEQVITGGGPSSVPKVMIVGDSVSWFIGRAFEERAAEVGDVWAWNTAVYGCGIGRGGDIRVVWGDQPTLDSCNEWDERWRTQVEEFDPDVVVVLTGMWDLTDRRLPQWEGYRGVGDPAYDAWLLSEYESAVDVLASDGAHVAWLTSPCAEDLRGGVLSGSAAWDEERLAHFNGELLPELDARREEVSLVDLHSLACPGGAFTQVIGGHENARRDGAHFSGPAARWLVDQMLPELLQR